LTQENDPIRLFVTHLYAPDDSYFRVFEYLESQPNFYYKNLATPDKPPRSKEKEAIREDLRRQMTDAEVLVILSDLYLRPGAIEYQCLYAQTSEKPLVVLEPFGTTAPVPAKLREMADEVVPWNGREMADAIRRQARHEDTTRWDVIEFKLD
jgi:hypothetical protein